MIQHYEYYIYPVCRPGPDLGVAPNVYRSTSSIYRYWSDQYPVEYGLRLLAGTLGYTMSDAPTRYTSYVYPMLHNMCTRHTRHTRPARRTYCADYLQSDARGEVLTPT